MLGIATLRPAPPDLAGEPFGSYVIGRVLGQGGMGVVYEAFDTRLGRMVALKMLADDIGASDQLRREAELAASLEHEHIVPVYEADEHDGIAYLTMKLIEGGPLETPAASPRRAAEIAWAMAKAIDFAHRHGVLHLDLKPSNVLVDRDGRSFLTDFGLATRDGIDSGGTLAPGGTPLYMAPEVWRGESGAASIAADVWGAGALLYEMLTGQPPFQASSKDELLKRVTAEPPPPLVGVSANLAAVCLKCLEKDPARRYATAGELAADIERYLDGEPVEARPVARWIYRSSRHPVVLGFVVLTIFYVIAMLVVQTRLDRTKEAMADVANAAGISLAMQVAMQLREYAQSVEAGSTDPRVIAALSGQESTPPSRVCEQLFHERGWPFAVWFMLDMDGKVVGRAPQVVDDMRSASAFTFRDYYIGALEKDRRGERRAYISRAYKSAFDGDYKFAFSIVVHDNSSKQIGLLVATLPTGSMLGSIQLPDVERKDITLALVTPRDTATGPMTNGLGHDEHTNGPELVFLLLPDLGKGAEVSAHVSNANATFGGELPLTRIVPVEGTYISVLVSVADRSMRQTMPQTSQLPKF